MTSVVLPDALTFERLCAAMDACSRAHPAAPPEYQLHADVNVMADLFALMALGKMTQVPIADVEQRILEAFQRWSINPAS